MSAIAAVDKGPPPLGRKLASRRVLLGLSRKQVASAVGITPVSVSRIETGERKPSLRVLHAMAQFYGTTVDEMIRDTDLVAA